MSHSRASIRVVTSNRSEPWRYRPERERFATSAIRLMDEFRRLGDAMRAETQADIDAENAMWRALYEEEKQDLDEELDWLGEWRGRRG